MVPVALIIAAYVAYILFIIEPARDQFNHSQTGLSIQSISPFVSVAHTLKGTLYLAQNQHRFVHFENFSTRYSANLHVLLATDTYRTKNIDLGKLKSFAGNMTYALPDTVAIKDYQYILIWSPATQTLYGYARMYTS